MTMKKADLKTASARPAGWDKKSFAHGLSVSPGTLDNIPPEHAPKSTKIGKRRIYTESPADYLARIEAMGGIPTRKPEVQQAPRRSNKRSRDSRQRATA